jgi:hypothetical protein
MHYARIFLGHKRKEESSMLFQSSIVESGVKHHNSNSLNPENFVRNNERWRRRVVKNPR